MAKFEHGPEGSQIPDSEKILELSGGGTQAHSKIFLESDGEREADSKNFLELEAGRETDSKIFSELEGAWAAGGL